MARKKLKSNGCTSKLYVYSGHGKTIGSVASCVLLADRCTVSLQRTAFHGPSQCRLHGPEKGPDVSADNRLCKN